MSNLQKLHLHKETLRILGTHDATHVDGAGIVYSGGLACSLTTQPRCNTMDPTHCLTQN